MLGGIQRLWKGVSQPHNVPQPHDEQPYIPPYYSSSGTSPTHAMPQKTKEERLQLLEDILSRRQCTAEDESPFSSVPGDILTIIFDYVPPSSVVSCLFVCRRWAPVAFKIYLLKARRLFTFGLTSSGRLGLPETLMSSMPPTVVSALVDKSIVCMSCSASQTIVVDAGGHAYAFGNNGMGVLGLPSTSPAFEPTIIECLMHEYVTGVSCGIEHTVFSTTSGRVYTCGNTYKGRENFPVLVDEIPQGEEVIQISCGYAHAIALCKTHTFYTWGDNGYGQLGRDRDAGSEPRIIELPEVMGEVSHPVQVACGTYHTLVLMDNGVVWGFGCSIDGRLGADLTQQDRIYKPTLLKFPNHVDPRAPFKFVAGGRKTSAFISANGGIVFYGAALQVPEMLMFFDSPVVFVSLAVDHFGIVLQDGRLLMHGRDSDLRLGVTYRDARVVSPLGTKKTESFIVAPVPAHVIEVACGYHHTACVGSPAN